MINAPAFFGLLLTISYLLGAIPFSLIISKYYGVDLGKVGSGNFGASNVFRSIGWKPGLFVFILDVLKGVLPTLCAVHYFPQAMVVHFIIAFSAIFGHSFSLFLGFKGGKGVATTVGCLVVLMPMAMAITMPIVLVVIGVTRIVSLGSLLGCVLLPIILYLQSAPRLLVIFVSIISVLVMLRHQSNILRLVQGKEHRL